VLPLHFSRGGISALLLFCGMANADPAPAENPVRRAVSRNGAEVSPVLGWISLAGVSGAVGLGFLRRRSRRTDFRGDRLVLRQTLGLRPQVAVCEVEWAGQLLLIAVTPSGCTLLSSAGSSVRRVGDGEGSA